uniref:Uncharacterized protein n=1 Tax=Helicotheca tamesis TaxID=374047 RepID=A0A7S2H9W4_9STRA
MSAEELITKFVHQTLSHNITYDKANVWQRNKVKYPRISLDEIRVELPFQQEQEKEEKGEEMKWKESVLSSIQDQTTQQEEEGMVHPVPLKYILVCTVDESTKLEIPLYSEIPSSFSTSSKKMQYEMKNSELIAKSSCYIYDTMTSTSFLMICLALRYKCPIVMTSKVLDSFVNIQNLLNVENKNICLVYKQQLQQQKEETSTDDDDEGMDGNEINNTKKTKKAQKLQLEQQKKEEAHLSQILPSWKAANAIRKTSERVDRTVQRGFEENKLRGALRIALEKGDQVAVEKIRGEIERLRSLEDEEEEEEE